jgi:hypothetical protein
VGCFRSLGVALEGDCGIWSLLPLVLLLGYEVSFALPYLATITVLLHYRPKAKESSDHELHV